MKRSRVVSESEDTVISPAYYDSLIPSYNKTTASTRNPTGSLRKISSCHYDETESQPVLLQQCDMTVIYPGLASADLGSTWIPVK
jgi:hypothetical protein